MLEAAKAAKIEIAWLPFRLLALNPCEVLWRLLKSVSAANRVSASKEAEAERAVACLDGLTEDGRVRRGGLNSSKFQGLPAKWCIR